MFLVYSEIEENAELTVIKSSTKENRIVFVMRFPKKIVIIDIY